MKKVLSIFTLFAVMFGLMASVDAATKLHEDFASEIYGWKIEYGTWAKSGNAKVWEKGYEETSGIKDSGRAICSLFAKQVPPYKNSKVKCNLMNWSDDATQNKKVAAGVGAVIQKARELSNGGKSIAKGDDYLFAEMAINQFLYEKNGGNADNNISAKVSKTNWEYINSQDHYKKMLSEATSAYDNYSKKHIVLSSPKINITYDSSNNVTSATATVTATCYGADGNKLECNFTNKQIKSGSQTKDLTVTSSSETSTNLSANITDIAQSVGSGNLLKVDFTVESNYSYNVAHQYNCGDNYQRLVPNKLRTISEPTSATATKSATLNAQCQFTLKKTDGTNALNGAKFELYEVINGQDVLIDTITVNGEEVITDLKPADYKLVEIEAPKGYSIQTDTIPVQLNDGNNNCVANVEKTVVNTKEPGNLKINKIDENNNNVAGATIKIYRTVKKSDGTYGPEYVMFGDKDYFETTAEPKIVENLIVGETYTVVEEKAPDETYALKKCTDVVTIKAGLNEVTLENNHSTFKVSKQDINSSKEIPGAHLEIFYENETSTGWSWVSTDKPQEITGLADGKYILVETTAPQGYTVAESIPFTIENGKLKDRDANTLVMKDATIIDVPDTFNMQNVIAMISGLVLVSLGTGVLFYETKKKKKA